MSNRGYPYSYPLPEGYGDPNASDPRHPAPSQRSLTPERPVAPTPRPVFSSFTQLIQFCDDLDNLINYRDARQHIIDLYNGHSTEDWFLVRILTLLDLLVGYVSGVSFLSHITAKIDHFFPDWFHSILNRFSSLLAFEPGVHLIINIVKRYRTDHMISKCVREMLLLFDRRTDDNYRHLFENLIKIFRGRKDLMEIFYAFQWLHAPTLMRYFAMALRYLPWEKMRQNIEPLVSDPLPYLRDGGLALGYAAILQYVEDERDRMMNYLVNSIEFFIISPDSAVILRAIVNLASFAQQDVLLGKFETLLREAGAEGLRTDIMDVMEKLLITVSTKTRLTFLKRNQESLTVLGNARFAQNLAYMEFVLNQQNGA
jgi:hypothetical protein